MYYHVIFICRLSFQIPGRGGGGGEGGSGAEGQEGRHRRLLGQAPLFHMVSLAAALHKNQTVQENNSFGKIDRDLFLERFADN
jgi:hypothetical protein